MPRRLIIALAIITLLLIPTAGASADEPSREDAPPLDMVFTGVCDFPVEAVTLVNRGKLTTFYNRIGEPVRQIGTGALKVQLTNLATGESLVVNISGPVFIKPQADGTATITLGGRSLLILRAGIDAPPAGLLLNSGQLRFTVDPEGAVTEIVSQSGRQQDLCAALAP